MNMDLELRIQRGMRQIVSDYIEYSRSDDCFDLLYEDVPEYEIDKLVAIFMEDSDHAAEACGPDNDAFEDKMRPALHCAFKNHDWELVSHTFAREWMGGVRSYFEDRLREELEQQIVEYNNDFSKPDEMHREYTACGEEARL
jgi:hypothetical protein